MGKLITLGYLRIQFLFPFLAPVFSCIRQYIWISFPEGNKEGLTYLLSLVLFISQMLCGVLELISKIRQKTEKSKYLTKIKTDQKEQTIISQSISLIDAPKKKKSRIVILFLILATFLDLFSTVTLSLISLVSPNFEKNVESEMRIIQIIFLCFLCKIFLKYSIHKHHIVSIIIIGIGMFFVCLDTFSSIKISTKVLIETVLYLLCYLFYAIQDVIEKHVMEKEHISPYGLLFLEGLIGLIIIVCLFCFSFIIPSFLNNENNTIGKCIIEIFKFIFVGQSYLILYFFLIIFASVGYNLFIVLTNYYFSPSHINVSDTLSLITIWILMVITNKKNTITSNWFYASKIFGFIIIFLGGLIYNEIIICHFYKLDEYTKKEIIERAKGLGEVNFSIEEIEGIQL